MGVGSGLGGGGEKALGWWGEGLRGLREDLMIEDAGCRGGLMKQSRYSLSVVVHGPPVSNFQLALLHP